MKHILNKLSLIAGVVFLLSCCSFNPYYYVPSSNSRSIHLGMSKSEVTAACGAATGPTFTGELGGCRKSVSIYGTSEICRDCGYFFYFSNGKLARYSSY